MTWPNGQGRGWPPGRGRFHAAALVWRAMTEVTRPAGSGDMGQRVTRGLAWIGASQVMLQVIRTGAAIFVARLLTPSEYGLAMLALVFASLVLVFSDLALGAALVQRKNLTEQDRVTAFWITVGSGVVFTVLGVALSGPVAALYGEPDGRAAARRAVAQLPAHRARRDAAVAAAARDELPPAGDDDRRRRAGRRRRRRSCSRRWAPGRGRSSASSSRPPPSPAPCCGARPRGGRSLIFSRASARDLGALQRLPRRAPAPVLPAPERRPLPDRRATSAPPRSAPTPSPTT